jgi:hypothetical protein
MTFSISARLSSRDSGDGSRDDMEKVMYYIFFIIYMYFRRKKFTNFVIVITRKSYVVQTRIFGNQYQYMLLDKWYHGQGSWIYLAVKATTTTSTAPVKYWKI